MITSFSLLFLITVFASPGITVDATVSYSLKARCLAASSSAYREEAVRIPGEGGVLQGRLFLPVSPGPHPAVVLLPGGGRERLRGAPLFYAKRLAQCGAAALVYDKRGTGDSGGDWETAHFDDFVADAAAAVTVLGRRSDVDAHRIGLLGFSQGGRLAPVVAARHSGILFVAGVSAPFTSIAETRLYALEQALQRRGVQGAALDSTMHLWRAHFEAVADDASEALVELDDAIREAAARVSPGSLPPTSEHLLATPLYNSMGHDYTRELQYLRIPLLVVYGDRDAVVPVQRSVEALSKVLADGGHPGADIVVVPFANHSFNDHTFGMRIEIEEVILDWILARFAGESGTPRTYITPDGNRYR
ncbi:MAG: alpha/beta hydrolase family protein [Rhodothermales bacterium]